MNYNIFWNFSVIYNGRIRAVDSINSDGFIRVKIPEIDVSNGTLSFDLLRSVKTGVLQIKFN